MHRLVERYGWPGLSVPFNTTLSIAFLFLSLVYTEGVSMLSPAMLGLIGFAFLVDFATEPLRIGDRLDGRPYLRLVWVLAAMGLHMLVMVAYASRVAESPINPSWAEVVLVIWVSILPFSHLIRPPIRMAHPVLPSEGEAVDADESTGPDIRQDAMPYRPSFPGLRPIFITILLHGASATAYHVCLVSGSGITAMKQPDKAMQVGVMLAALLLFLAMGMVAWMMQPIDEDSP